MKWLKRRGRRARSVRSRLVMLAAVPLVMLLATAGVGVKLAVHDAARTSAAARAAKRSTRLLAVYEALMTERTAAGAMAAAGELGLSIDAANQLYGADLVAELRAARSAVDDVLVTSGLSAQVDTGHLAAVRARVDARVATVAEVLTWFGDEATSVRDMWTDSLGVVDRDARGTGSAELSQALRALRHASDASAIGWDRYRAASSLAFPNLSASDATILHLAEAAALFTQATRPLSSELTGSALAAWQHGVLDDPDARTFEQLVASTLDQSVPSSPTDLTALASKFRSGVVLQDHLAHVAHLAGQQVQRIVDDIRRDVRSTLAIYLLATGGVIITTVTSTLVLSRGISGPLRLLARRARAVSDGVLDGPPLSCSGPQEVADAIRAFNDATRNLGHLYAGVVAMGTGDPEMPALGRPPEGALGRTLGVALARLSDSIRESRALRDEMEARSLHDELTGLANRRLVIEQLQTMLEQSKRSGLPVSVLFLDLDQFKQVNDNHGHAAGDLVLKATADRLTQVCRRADLVGRLGGDEFVIVAQSTAAETRPLRDRILHALAAPIDLHNGTSVTCPASIGVADTSTEQDADALLTAADHAMYVDKQLRHAHASQ